MSCGLVAVVDDSGGCKMETVWDAEKSTWSSGAKFLTVLCFLTFLLHFWIFDDEVLVDLLLSRFQDHTSLLNFWYF